MIFKCIGSIGRQYQRVPQNFTIFQVLVKYELIRMLYQCFCQMYTKLDSAKKVAGLYFCLTFFSFF